MTILTSLGAEYYFDDIAEVFGSLTQPQRCLERMKSALRQHCISSFTGPDDEVTHASDTCMFQRIITLTTGTVIGSARQSLGDHALSRRAVPQGPSPVGGFEKTGAGPARHPQGLSQRLRGARHVAEVR